MIVNRPGWSQSYAPNTDNDADQITGSGASVVYYVLYADPPNEGRHSQAQFSQLFNAVVAGCLLGSTSSPVISQVRTSMQDVDFYLLPPSR